jgi:hypothetical protein
VRDFSRNAFKLCKNPLYRDAAAVKIDCIEYPQLSDNPAGHRRHHKWRSRLGH